MRVDLKKTFLLFLTFLMILVTTELNYAESASDPYTVPTNVKNNWNNTVGGKNFDMRTGRNLVYDIYSNKYINGGYRITNQNFGKGSQPYLHFSGWAINFGHKRHTSSNHETYIVARQNGNASNTKIYSTIPINISATKEVEYNNQGGTGVWNECSSGATNKSNVPSEDNGCNMRYDNVGFHAYLPLNELFPDKSKGVTYSLFIVKRVDSHIVYSPLVLPFDFDNRSFNGGEIQLSSGINANKLTMRSYPVVRRKEPRNFSGSGSTLGYFEQFRQYTRVASDESGTAVWYGVRSPHDNNQTRWNSTAYWNFDGDQAVIRFIPDSTPPEHREHEITNHRYKNGNNYWVQPNDKVNIRLRGYDLDTHLERTNLQLSGSATARARHIYGTSTSEYEEYYTKSSHIDFFSGRSTYQSTNQRLKEATFQIAPKTHGHSYDISAYHRDHANNNSGWVNTNMKLRVDGVKPVHIHQNISGERYREGNNYWIRPSDVVQVAIRGRDLDSGLNNTMISIGSSNNRITGKHEFSGSNTNLTRPINTTTEMTLVSANRTYTSGNIREVTFDVRGNTHGASHAIRHRYEDNVNNISDGDGHGWSDFEKYIKVDGEAPIRVSETINGHRYKDTNNVHWIRPGETLEITQRGKDSDSGLEQTRLSTGEGSNRNIARHNFSGTTTNMTITNNSTDFDVLSANRTYNSTETKEVTYIVRGNTHGSTHSIRSYYKDNVGNESTGDSNGWNTATNIIGVDGEGPNVRFRNEQDSADFLNREWDNNEITVRLKLNDSESGYKRSRYAWTLTKDTPSESEWSSWTTNNNYVTTINRAGEWYLHVQAEDQVGNITENYAGIYKLNTPPVPGFELDKEEYWQGDDVCVKSIAYDPDGHQITHKYIITLPNGEVIEKNTPDFCINIEHEGELEIEQIVTDEYGAEGSITVVIQIRELTLTGTVSHTPQWLEFHEQKGNLPHQFYSGETLVLTAIPSDYPAAYVKATLLGELVNGTFITRSVNLTKEFNNLYRGEMDGEDFIELYPLKKGHVPIEFEVEYINGQVRTYI
ncbi:hypothetical protein ACEK07_00205, partial [Alcanivoracaceae bacterium MT1]